jgi:gliding motility-associated-like protein
LFLRGCLNLFFVKFSFLTKTGLNKRLLYLLIIALAFLTVCNKGYGQAPVINSFAPASGNIGTQVTISGSNFNSSTGGNIVYFGATRATVSTASPTSLTVKVPVGATFQPITVLNTASHLTGYSNYPFHVTFPSNGTILPNNFDARVSFGTGNAPSCVSISDLDGDGKPDMLVINAQSGSMSIFRNTAVSGVINSASFAPKIDIPTGFLPAFADISDLDGDGKAEVVVTNAAGNNISIYKNISTPGNIQFNNKVDIATSSFPANIKIADLDGDGKPDLAVAHNTVGPILSIYKNVTNWGSITPTSFEPEIVVKTGFGYSYVDVADLDNDNKPELLLTNAYTDAPVHLVYVFRNIGNQGGLSAASFEAAVSYTSAPNPLVVNVADMNNDNKPDMVISNFGDRIFAQVSSNFNLSVLLNQKNTTGAFNNNSFAFRQNYPTQRIPQSSTIGDFDGDGLMDAIVGNYGDNTLSIFHNQSTAGRLNINSQINLPAGLSPLRIAVADIDGDGKTDILAVNDLDNTVSIYRNNASAIQNINFDPLSRITYGTENLTIGATSNNPNNPLKYSSSNTLVATVSSTGIIHTVGVGTSSITVSQDATANLAAATPVTRNLTVTPAPLNIKANNNSKDYRTANPVFTATFTGLVNNDTENDVVSDLIFNTTADLNSIPGNYAIMVNGINASPNYTITYGNGLLTINKLNQSIIFAPIENKFFNTPDFTISATASSGNLIIFTSSDNSVAAVNSNTIHIITTGKTTITATQPGNEIYNPISAFNTLTILPIPVIITANTITPNDDGINDKWVVTGIDNKTMVNVFNRYGKIVFQSKGYTTQFNGTFNGKKLPAGVYYYLIAFTDNRTNLSGSLTVLY